MAQLPAINATITRVVREAVPGLSTVDTVKWVGALPARTTSRVTVEGAGGVSTITRADTLVIPSSVPVAHGDRVTFTSHGVESSMYVSALEPHPDLGYTRIFASI